MNLNSQRFHPMTNGLLLHKAWFCRVFFFIVCFCIHGTVAPTNTNNQNTYFVNTSPTFLKKVALEGEERSQRQFAVESLFDQALLAEIAVEARDWYIRRSATKKLTDPLLLIKIQNEDHDEDVRQAAEKNFLFLTLSEMCEKDGIVSNQKFFDVLNQNDQRLLARIILKDKNRNRSFAAIERLTDQSQLAKIAIKTKKWCIGYRVMQKMSDQTWLSKIAKKAKIQAIRPLAVEKITDRKLLASIAIENRDPDVRSIAAERIFNQTLLEKISTTDQDLNVCKVAIWNIRNQSFLKAIALDHLDSGVRRAAVRNLANDNLLMKIVFFDKDINVRSKAVQKITNPNSLLKIVMESNDFEIYQSAINNLEDLAILAKASVEAKNDSVRKCATEKLSVLAGDRATEIRKIVLEKLNDQVLISEIAAQDKDSNISLAAIYMITDQSLLLKVSFESKNENIRQAGMNRLNNNLLNVREVIYNYSAVIEENKKQNSNSQVLRKTIELTEPEFYGQLEEQISLAKTAILANTWDVSREALFKITDPLLLTNVAMESKSTSVRRRAAHRLSQAFRRYLAITLILRGDESRVPEILTLLNQYGDKTLAEDYINCGHPVLASSAREWAIRNGFRPTIGSGSHRATWGSNK